MVSWACCARTAGRGVGTMSAPFLRLTGAQALGHLPSMRSFPMLGLTLVLLTSLLGSGCAEQKGKKKEDKKEDKKDAAKEDAAKK